MRSLLTTVLLLPLLASSVEAEIDSVTTIKGYSATMSLSEFQEVSRSHNPVAHPEENVFAFVEECAKTQAEWYAELGIEGDENICEALAAGPSSLTVGGIPIQKVNRFFSKPDHEIEYGHQFDDSVSFTFAGVKHQDMYRVLRRKYGEPDFSSDANNPSSNSFFIWNRTADFENRELWQQTLGLQIELNNMTFEGDDPVMSKSYLSLKQTDEIRKRKWLKAQTDDF